MKLQLWKFHPAWGILP